MKNLILLSFLAVFFIYTSCNKNEEPILPDGGNEEIEAPDEADDENMEIKLEGTVYLFNKPLESVKNAIIGTWKLDTLRNGFAGTERWPENTYWIIARDSLHIITDEQNESLPLFWLQREDGYASSRTNVCTTYESDIEGDILSPFDMVISRYQYEHLYLSSSHLDGNDYILSKSE